MPETVIDKIRDLIDQCDVLIREAPVETDKEALRVARFKAKQVIEGFEAGKVLYFQRYLSDLLEYCGEQEFLIDGN